MSSFNYSKIVKNGLEAANEKERARQIEENERLAKSRELELELEKIYNCDESILPIYNNKYNRRNTITWLCKKNDKNMYNYDYCVIMFEKLITDINNNNFKIRIPQHVMFAKFLSLMFLLSYNGI